MREYVLGAMIVPSLMCFVWFALVGGTAIDLELTGKAHGAIVAAGQESQLFAMLGVMLSPGLAWAMSIVVVVLLLTYLVTTADSAVLIINTINAAGDEGPKARPHILFWGVALALVVGALIVAGGLGAIKTAMVIGALPFSLVMVLMGIALIKGIWLDSLREKRGMRDHHRGRHPSGAVAPSRPRGGDAGDRRDECRRLLRSSSGRRRAHVLGPHAHAEHAGDQVLQRRHGGDQTHRQRHAAIAPPAPRRAPARARCPGSPTCAVCVARVGQRRRRRTASRSSAVDGAVAQLGREQVGRRDRVLDREVDADAADRRHRVRRVADAEQPGLRPLREPVDADGEQLDVVPRAHVVDVGREQRRRGDDLGAERGDVRCACSASAPPLGMTKAHCQ